MRVQRWTPTSKLFTGATIAIAVLLATVPLLWEADVVQKLTNLLILVLLAAMWNALAGYGGLLSVGQQAFIGIGAYATVFFAGLGVSPYLAMVLAMLVAGVISIPISFLALRLRAAQFAIGMWVIAEVISILVRLDQNPGRRDRDLTHPAEPIRAQLPPGVHVLAGTGLHDPFLVCALFSAAFPTWTVTAGSPRR